MPNESDVLDDFTLGDDEVDETDVTEEVDDPDAGEAGEVDGDEGDEEPEDLASAFAALQRSRQDDAAGDLGDGGDLGDDDAADDDDGQDEALEDDRQDPAGGPGDAYAGADLQAVEQQMTQQVSQLAIRQAAAEFQKEGIRPITMNDLYRRDESTGRVVYQNPDDPSRPFSNRMEAQQWIDSFNSQLRQEIQTKARSINRELQRQVAPTRNLIQFVPRYQGMSRDAQEILDDLIEGSEVRNARGEVVGYTCDLDSMANRAERMAAKYSRGKGGKGDKSDDQHQQQRRPATDMRSHGSSSEPRKLDREPRDINEAWQIMHERRKAGNR